MVPTFVRRARVIIIKLVILVLDVDLLVVLEQDKRLRVRHRLIEYVHKTYVLVPLVQLLLVQHVQQMVLPFVRLVVLIIIKMAMLALDVDLLVVLDQEKRLLVLPQPTEYVPRIRAFVPMV